MTKQAAFARRALKLLVLIPHRDVSVIMFSFKRALFREGFAGAWSFPPVVPLALLSRQSGKGELRELAEKLRSMLGNKKITGTAWAGTAFPAPLPGEAHGAAGAAGALPETAPLPGLWGVSLDMPLPSFIMEGKKNSLPFDSPVLVSALTRGSVAAPPELPPPRGITFRAAALASMLFAPLAEGPGNGCPEQGSLSFAWELDEPVWLPNPKRRSRG
ncbi:MAG: hypothetical protein LBK40_06640 [Spirochaetaceae bacterium]|nr:hypothetical protein [Spirochaetaceae bacterium]